jgi:gamma-glutamylaminecyclotransferase
MTKYIFVYGTLMSGFGNHRILKGEGLYGAVMEPAELLGAYTTLPKYTMIDLGAFPGIVEGGETAIFGEIYCVRLQAMLDRLDRLEGHPNFYCRKPIEIGFQLGARLSVEAYFLPQSELRRATIVRSGNWRARNQ